jgi:aminomethyltransferase
MIAGVPVEISRTGYTGDLGYEIWMRRAGDQGLGRIDGSGRAFDIHPAGMLALDVARVEAGLLLIEVDFNSSKKALVDEQTIFAFRNGTGTSGHLDKNRFVGQAALIDEQKRGHAREIVGLEIDWPQVESLYEKSDCRRQFRRCIARRGAVFKEGIQVGKATTTTWMIALRVRRAKLQLRSRRRRITCEPQS